MGITLKMRMSFGVILMETPKNYLRAPSENCFTIQKYPIQNKNGHLFIFFQNKYCKY